jgi:hypothetical protein
MKEMRTKIPTFEASAGQLGKLPRVEYFGLRHRNGQPVEKQEESSKLFV